jgi:hypothetical protein
MSDYSFYDLPLRTFVGKVEAGDDEAVEILLSILSRCPVVAWNYITKEEARDYYKDGQFDELSFNEYWNYLQDYQFAPIQDVLRSAMEDVLTKKGA